MFDVTPLREDKRLRKTPLVELTERGSQHHRRHSGFLCTFLVSVLFERCLPRIGLEADEGEILAEHEGALHEIAVLAE